MCATPAVNGSPHHRVGLRVVWSALGVLATLPFAVVGALVHVVPFQIMKQVGKRPTNEGIKATVKLLGCFVLFAATYVVLGVLVGASTARGPGSARLLPHRCVASSRYDCWSGCGGSAAWSRGTGSCRRTATSSDRCWRTAPRSCGRRDRSCVSRETGHRQVRPDRAQVAEVWRPETVAGVLPVVVLIHGGFWHQHFTKRLMHRLELP